MMSTAAKANNTEKNAGSILASLRAQYEAWEPVEGQARKKLWELLGDVYEAIGYFEANPNEMPKLREAARDAPGVRECARFKAFEEKAVDLLLVSLLGIRKETAATKSQWRSALMAAHLAQCEYVSTSLQQWLAEVGGIIGATKADLKAAIVGSDADKKASHEELMLEKFNMDKFAKGIADQPPKESIKVALDRQTETYGGLGLALLFVPEGGKPDDARLVEKIGDPAVVRRVCAQIAQGHAKQLTEEEKKARLLDQYLWTLNQVTLSLAGRLELKFTHSVWKAFMAAVKGITNDDRYAQKYFAGFSGVGYYTFKQAGWDFTMQVKNPDFLEVDPGRYFGGARKGALIPYDVSKFGEPEGEAALKEYVLRHAEPWRYCTGR